MNYMFVRKYATHAESWVVLSVEVSVVPVYTPLSGFKTQDGEWFVMHHNYYQTDEEADKDYQDYARSFSDIDESLERIDLLEFKPGK